eukprot:3438237-Amphidinium_carterae.1
MTSVRNVSLLLGVVTCDPWQPASTRAPSLPRRCSCFYVRKCWQLSFAEVNSNSKSSQLRVQSARSGRPTAMLLCLLTWRQQNAESCSALPEISCNQPSSS